MNFRLESEGFQKEETVICGSSGGNCARAVRLTAVNALAALSVPDVSKDGASSERQLVNLCHPQNESLEFHLPVAAVGSFLFYFLFYSDCQT